MIQVLAHRDVDQQKWDECILESEFGSIYGLYDVISVACENWLGIVHNEIGRASCRERV